METYWKVQQNMQMNGNRKRYIETYANICKYMKNMQIYENNRNIWKHIEKYQKIQQHIETQ